MYNQFLDIKYKHGSFNAAVGLDCLTFVLYFYKTIYELDIAIDVPDYKVDWHKDTATASIYTKGIFKHCKNVMSYSEEIPLKVHSILFFSYYNDANRITHAGIYIGKGLFIHCLEKHGVCISKIATFKNRLKLIGELI